VLLQQRHIRNTQLVISGFILKAEWLNMVNANSFSYYIFSFRAVSLASAAMHPPPPSSKVLPV
jgi:hypothetical protein